MKYECICKLIFHSFCSLWGLQRLSTQYKRKLGDVYKYKSAGNVLYPLWTRTPNCFLFFSYPARRVHEYIPIPGRQILTFCLKLSQTNAQDAFSEYLVWEFMFLFLWSIQCVVIFRQRANLKISTSPAFYWVKTKQISVFSVLRHKSRGSFANIHTCCKRSIFLITCQCIRHFCASLTALWQLEALYWKPMWDYFGSQ